MSASGKKITTKVVTRSMAIRKTQPGSGSGSGSAKVGGGIGSAKVTAAGPSTAGAGSTADFGRKRSMVSALLPQGTGEKSRADVATWYVPSAVKNLRTKDKKGVASDLKNEESFPTLATDQLDPVKSNRTRRLKRSNMVATYDPRTCPRWHRYPSETDTLRSATATRRTRSPEAHTLIRPQHFSLPFNINNLLLPRKLGLLDACWELIDFSYADC